LTNAISAIAVVGAILIAGAKDASTLSRGTGICGGHRIDHQRGQRVSHHRPHVENVQKARYGEALMDLLIQTSYLAAAGLFILSLKGERSVYRAPGVLAAKWACWWRLSGRCCGTKWSITNGS